jgi:hypothetical protein
LAVAASALIGLLAAYSIASEPIAYIASMFFGVYLYLMIPFVLALVIVAAIIAATSKQRKIAWALFLGAIVLPASYIGGFQTMRALGWVVSETNGSNEMRPFGLKPNGSLTLVYNEGVTYEEKEAFSKQFIHPWKEGPGFTHETGVCESGSLRDIGKRTVEEVIFCESATDEKKDKLRMGAQASPIVYRFFEDLPESEVRTRLERTVSNTQRP